MAVVHTEYVNSAGNDYGRYTLKNTASDPTSGLADINNATLANVTSIEIFDVDLDTKSNSLPFEVLTTSVFGNNEYFLIISNTNGIDPEIGDTDEFIRYNLTSATFGSSILTLNLSHTDGNGTNVAIDGTVYIRIYGDVSDSSSVDIVATRSEISENELFSIRITVIG